jgi:hypothetical protein
MKKALFAITIMIISLCATMALADDTKVYPASMAVRWSAAEPVPTLNYSQIFNPSTTQWLKVDLPIIHDGGSIKNGWVKAIDMHFSAEVQITLFSVYRTGCSIAGWSSPSQRTNGTNCVPQTLNFGALSSISDAHYFYGCLIPPAYSGQLSGIVSYRIKET